MLPCLRNFLANQHLSQYYESFLNAGASNADSLSHLVGFTDNDLNDLLSAVCMRPFHVIIFKRALKQLGPVHPDMAHQSEATAAVAVATTPPPQNIIYGTNKHRQRPLTRYESAINEAAVQLVAADPGLAQSKGTLLRRAKEVLLESGYAYKRGRSRSKLVVAAAQQRRMDVNAQRACHAAQTARERTQKMDAIHQRLDIVTTTLHQTLVVNKDIHTARNLESTRKELFKELSKLKAQQRKHIWYEDRKRRASAAEKDATAATMPAIIDGEED